MRNTLRPAWLLFINTLPLALMAWIYHSNYRIIESLLPDEAVALWIRFGSWLGVLWLAHLAYAIILIYKKRTLHGWYGIVTLALYIPFLYLYYLSVDDMLPRSVPMWMMPEDISIFAGTFVMPTLAHALFVQVVALTHRFEKKTAGFSFLYAALVPLAWYIFLQVILPLWKPFERSSFSLHVTIIVCICGAVLFLFFLVRCFYILAARNKEMSPVYQISWKFVIALLFPLLGLIVNNKYDDVFGNFNSAWFYVLVIINGIVITLPAPTDKRQRLALFVVRSITFSYIVYFFVVFLPYLPLSVVAIVAVGAGFLMLTPLALMILQSKMMVDDLRFLTAFYPKKFLIAVMLAGFGTIPLCITINYRYEKYVLHQALDHVYAADLSTLQEDKINSDRVMRVLDRIRTNKRRDWIFNRQTPFLSTYYHWLVLDNVTLSRDKIQLLENVFAGEPSVPSSDELALPQRGNVSINNITTHSVYDEKQQAYKSEVALDITNHTPLQAEFMTTFDLPEGSWISNYYLWIENEKVYGLLAEKKAATWIYQQITSYRRDPGILYYLSGNKLALRVFPVETEQTRKTGFEILHKDPVRFRIGEHTVALGDPERSVSNRTILKAGRAIYLSPEIKRSLPPVSRSPRYHFIIDCSAGNSNQSTEYIARIENYAREHRIDLDRSKFLLTNAYADVYDHWPEVQKELREKNCEGGFFLEHSLRKIFTNSYLHPSPEYPQVVVVTDTLSQALFTKGLSDLHFTFPESEIFLELTIAGHTIPHSLVDHPTAIATDSDKRYAVAAWPTATDPKVYVRLDDEATVVVDESTTSGDYDFSQHTWGTALALQGEWLDNVLHPEKNEEAWLPLVQKSFQSQIMTPVTSFISLENEAQRKALLQKQEALMNAKPSLDAGEETRMSEPGTIITLIILVLFMGRTRIKNFLRHLNQRMA